MASFTQMLRVQLMSFCSIPEPMRRRLKRHKTMLVDCNSAVTWFYQKRRGGLACHSRHHGTHITLTLRMKSPVQLACCSFHWWGSPFCFLLSSFSNFPLYFRCTVWSLPEVFEHVHHQRTPPRADLCHLASFHWLFMQSCCLRNSLCIRP